jgi:hypothetical protein
VRTPVARTSWTDVGVRLPKPAAIRLSGLPSARQCQMLTRAVGSPMKGVVVGFRLIGNWTAARSRNPPVPSIETSALGSSHRSCT